MKNRLHGNGMLITVHNKCSKIPTVNLSATLQLLPCAVRLS